LASERRRLPASIPGQVRLDSLNLSGVELHAHVEVTLASRRGGSEVFLVVVSFVALVTRPFRAEASTRNLVANPAQIVDDCVLVSTRC